MPFPFMIWNQDVGSRGGDYAVLLLLFHRYKGFLKDCPSGRLNKSDFSKIYERFFPFGDPNQFADYVFKSVLPSLSLSGARC